MTDGEVTIGEFARRSGLSLKALRLYDARGLLEPVRVDPASGYRYYDLGQLERARTISLLRRLEMPLGTIAEVLADPSRQAGAIRSWWDGRQRDLADRGPELDLVLQSLGAPGGPVHTGRSGSTTWWSARSGRAPSRRSAATCARTTWSPRSRRTCWNCARSSTRAARRTGPSTG